MSWRAPSRLGRPPAQGRIRRRRGVGIQARSGQATLQIIQFGIPIGWPSTTAASTHIGGSASVLSDLHSSLNVMLSIDVARGRARTGPA
jgi:hypothetical protein